MQNVEIANHTNRWLVFCMALFNYRSTVFCITLAKTASPAIYIYNCIVVPLVENASRSLGTTLSG